MIGHWIGCNWKLTEYGLTIDRVPGVHSRDRSQCQRNKAEKLHGYFLRVEEFGTTDEGNDSDLVCFPSVSNFKFAQGLKSNSMTCSHAHDMTCSNGDLRIWECQSDQDSTKLVRHQVQDKVRECHLECERRCEFEFECESQIPVPGIVIASDAIFVVHFARNFWGLLFWLLYLLFRSLRTNCFPKLLHHW